MSLITINFKKNMNIFTILIKLLNNDKMMIIINDMKLIYKKIKKKIKTLHEIIKNN